MNRRAFLHVSALAMAANSASRMVAAVSSQARATGYFSVAQLGDHWWLLTPERRPFFSIGFNHIDSAPLRYPETVHIWREKYGNSQERWLREAVAADLRAWGFNSVGWTQEVVVRGDTIHRHSPPFTFEEYQWLGLPYCHLLPLAETHQWEAETRYPDFFSHDFEEWCDYVARAHCARMADDPKLIGYFYVDCPTWVHTTKFNTWKGPLFDPGKLQTEAGRAELSRLATQYYRVTHDAVRRYDKNHLILGDRYEVNAPLPEEVVRAAMPFVDVLSFQCFGKPEATRKALEEWYDRTGKPVLAADTAGEVTRSNDGGSRHIGTSYAAKLRLLRELKGCVGMHLCGAYLRNHCRKRGLRDASERPDNEAIEAITSANRETQEWMEQAAPRPGGHEAER